MHIYFSGIGGVGIGPLAEIALDAGYEISGSDLQKSPLTEAIAGRGATVAIGQDGSQIAACHQQKPIDWFVYTAALPDDHPELLFAQKNNIHSSKRDELLARIIADKQLKLIAVTGTHGKTGTTAMLVWLFKQLGVPVSYSVGTTLVYGPSGQYVKGSEYFVYECDEYDRNFLHFTPHLSLVTSIDYDHPNTFPTVDDYKQAFREFLTKSELSLLWQRDERYLEPLSEHVSYEAFDETTDLGQIKLPGLHNRQNGFLTFMAMKRLFPDSPDQKLLSALGNFPGADRRFEKLGENLYTDYGHHPKEVAATLQLARELSDHVVLVYQPHQNFRQHHVMHEYPHSMELAEKIYWLPTYLTRENHLKILTPEELSSTLVNKEVVTITEMNEELWQHIEHERKTGKLVLVMSAGTIDAWVREQLKNPSIQTGHPRYKSAGLLTRIFSRKHPRQ